MKTFALALATTALTATVASAASISDFDQNGDRFASFSEVVAVNPTVDRNDFREIDTNRDNRLSSTEVQAAGAETVLDRGMNATGTVLSTRDISGGSFVTPAELQAAYPGLPTSQVRIIDQNKDNRISSVELAAAQGDLSVYEQGSQILVSLNSIDTDGSGFASLSELQTAYPSLRSNDLLSFDVNRDGRISFNELYSADAIEVLGENK